MAGRIIPESQQSPRDGPCRSIALGQAVTLHARVPMQLRVLRGTAWLTVDGPHRGAGDAQGDQVVLAGACVGVAAGRRLVLEPLGSEGVALTWAAARQAATGAFPRMLPPPGCGGDRLALRNAPVARPVRQG